MVHLAAALPRAPRFALRLPVAYRPAGGEAWLAGTTENISVSGALLAGSAAPDVDVPVDLRVRLPAADGSAGSEVVCQARVVRRAGAGEAFAVAISSYRLARAEDAARGA